MSAAEQIKRFCSVILGGADGSGDERLSGQMVYVWTLPDKRTRWCRADQPDAIASAVLDAKDNQRADGQGITAVYIGLGGVREDLARELGRRHRPQADQVDLVLALVADIDVAGFGHAGTNYPPDIDTARSILDGVGLPPTVVVHSGYGLQAWWVLADPVIMSQEADPVAMRERMAVLSRDWISTLRFRAHVAGGWKIDSVYDLSRVMRSPGTWNMKNVERPQAVKIVSLNARALYEPADFEDYLAPQSVLDAYAARSVGGAGTELPELPGVDLGETWARVNSEPYRRLGYEPEWMTIILDAEIGGERLADTWAGRRDDLAHDQSAYDAALVRMLAYQGVSLEQQVEAVMCRRLRVGEKVEKVDPTRRTDYLLRTFAFVRAQMEKDRTTGGEKITRMQAADAAVTAAPVTPDPEPVVGGDGDDFTDYLERQLDAATAPVDNVTALPLSAREEEIPPPDREPEPSYDDPPEQPQAGPGSSPPPTPLRKGGDEQPDPWGERNEATRERLEELAKLLIPEAYRDRGVTVWRLEHRDYGENQRGRVAFRLPEDFGWPTGAAPKLYRPGRPLFSEWYKRDVFETPKGFRMALERDALIPALQVGNRKEDWQHIISMLVSYWDSDSSATDLSSSAGEWLFNWLLSRVPTTEEHEALDNMRALLVRHNDWGAAGTPVIYLPKDPWLTYVATQPGGPKGRAGKELLAYVHLIPRRPRLTGGDGVPRRVSWYEIAADQFDGEEWAEILEAVRQAMESRNKDHLRVVGGGA